MTKQKLPVEQRHRDAAAPIFDTYGARDYAEMSRRGSTLVDDLMLVQAFARFEANLPHAQPPADPDLIKRALKAIKVGKMTGASGRGHPTNIYAIAEELIEAFGAPCNRSLLQEPTEEAIDAQ